MNIFLILLQILAFFYFFGITRKLVYYSVQDLIKFDKRKRCKRTWGSGNKYRQTATWHLVYSTLKSYIKLFPSLSFRRAKAKIKWIRRLGSEKNVEINEIFPREIRSNDVSWCNVIINVMRFVSVGWRRGETLPPICYFSNGRISKWYMTWEIIVRCRFQPIMEFPMTFAYISKRLRVDFIMKH